MIKRLIVLLIIVILVSSCSLVKPKESETTKEPTKNLTETPPPEVETPPETPVEEPVKNETETILPKEEPKESQTYFKVGEGRTIEINKSKLTVKEIHADGKVVIDVDGATALYSQTRQAEIINSWDVTLLKFYNFGSKNPENYVELEVKPLVLGPNEYILEKRWKKASIEGSEFELLDVRSSDQWIWVSVSSKVSEVASMGKDQTKTVNGWKLTNVRQFYLDKIYAIVRIEKV